MFGKLFRRRKLATTIATQPVGEVFPWPNDTMLKPLDRLVFALPVAMISPDETIGSAIDCDGRVEISIPEDDDKIYLRVPAGITVRLSKSVQAMILPWLEGETDPKRIEIVADAKEP